MKKAKKTMGAAGRRMTQGMASGGGLKAEKKVTEVEVSAASRFEHDQWRALVNTLIATGVVTETDANSPIRGHGQTPGQQVFAALRAWGDARVNLMGLDLLQRRGE